MSIRLTSFTGVVRKAQQVLSVLWQNFQPDERSLTAFRVVLAVGLLLDISNRFTNSAYFYSEHGILPRTLWETLYGHKTYYWTLHFLGGSEELFMGTLLFQMALILCLLVGYQTRWVSLFSWILLLSLVLRNPLLYYGGDKIAPILLLIATFLPLSASQRTKGALSLVTRLSFLWLLIQMVILYVASGVSKVNEAHWRDGTALGNVLDTNSLIRPLGLWFGQFEPLLRHMSVAMPWVEITLPLLFFVPLWRGRVRVIAVLGLLVLNLGIQTMLDVGYFMFYASAGLIALLPSAFWDDVKWTLHFVAARTGWTKPDIKLLSNWRRVPGSKTEWRVPRGLVALHKAGVATSCIVILCLASITVATSLESMKLIKLPYTPWSWTIIRGLNLYQNWGLFTNPSPTATWYVAKAKLANGTFVDILQAGGPVNWDHQEKPNALFVQNSKWRVAIAKISAFDNRDALLKAMGSALTAKWNSEHGPGEAVLKLTIYKFTQPLPIKATYGRRWQEWLRWPR